MTTASRGLHIKQALDEVRGRPGLHDTARIPLRGTYALLDVVELPLDIPVLNSRSFRIAPLLADHEGRATVEQDPESDAAQAIVAELVRRAHRHAEDLKGSLDHDGQDQPGVITRAGKLINGNSRCVLLRDLVRDGIIPASTTVRVAVLPSDISNKEELDLESVLQQQRDFKDEYNLVSRLMMLQTLSDSGMTDQAIATNQRETAAKITQSRLLLVLMNRARHLPSTPLPLSAFVTVEDQRENWVGLLKETSDIEQLRGRDAADEHIRGWLVAYFSGNDSVHQLRKATGDWLNRDMLPNLADSGVTGAAIRKAVVSEAERPTTQEPSEPTGVDILDVDSAPGPAKSAVAQHVLDIAVDASRHPNKEFALGDGLTVTGTEVKRILRGSVANGLDEAARRKKDSNRVLRPQTYVENAASALKSLVDALDEVVDDPEFVSRREDVRGTLDLVQSRLDEALGLLGDPTA